MRPKPVKRTLPVGTIHYPPPGQVTPAGRLSCRWAGNQAYLESLYRTRQEWMLEPFQKRGQEWVLEPRRIQKGEIHWAGEYAGKWLDAASLAAAGSREDPLYGHACSFAAALAAAQEADGYLGIELPASRGTGWDVWNVWNALTGLLTHYDVSHSESCLDAAVKCGQWLVEWYGLVTGGDHPFFTGAHDNVVNAPVIDQLVRLYQLTHDRKLLDFAWSVVDHYPHIETLRNGKAPLIHVYHLAGFLGGVVELAAADDTRIELPWIEEVTADLAERHLYPTGSLGFREFLRDTAPNDIPVSGGQPDKHHQETCATVEWLLLTARLYRATGHVRYMQAMEKTIYNALLAAQSMDGLQWMYYTPLRYEKRWFSGPTSCCYWSGPRALSRLPGWIYALDGAGIRVNLFEPGEAALQLDGCMVTIQQSSRYPDYGQVWLQLFPETPVSFPLRLRIPPGVHKPRVKLNGLPLKAATGGDGYYSIQHSWSAGDQVELEFEIPTCVEHFLNDGYGVVVRGPEVLSVDQVDNPGLDLDQVVIEAGMSLHSLEPLDGRRRYTGTVWTNDRQVQVIFTPYAEAGGEGSRFRTAFPILPGRGV
jgi:DUF1680 family protein